MNGYIRKMTKEEITRLDDSVSTVYPVRNPKKPRKVRCVYNAAAKFQGKCLNNFIYSGPDLLGSLFGILPHFRQGVFTLCADAKDMYLVLYVPPQDKPALCFLYRSNKS